MTICSIVEGDGEVEAVPILLRRIAAEVSPEIILHVPRPIRLPRTKIKRDDELKRAVQLAKLGIKGTGGIFILMDADDDCPAKLGPRLKERSLAVAGDVPVGVVIAKAEFEAWFLAAAESIAGKRGLAANLTAPQDPESIRAAKGWLDRQMPPNRCYRETLDQPALASLFDMASARRAQSFAKCYREVAKLLQGTP